VYGGKKMEKDQATQKQREEFTGFPDRCSQGKANKSKKGRESGKRAKNQKTTKKKTSRGYGDQVKTPGKTSVNPREEGRWEKPHLPSTLS